MCKTERPNNIGSVDFLVQFDFHPPLPYSDDNLIQLFSFTCKTEAVPMKITVCYPFASLMVKTCGNPCTISYCFI